MRRFLTEQAKAAGDLVVTGLMSLVAVRLGVNRYAASGDERQDLICLCCGSPMRPDTTTMLGALVCTNCQRQASDYEGTLPGLILPLDLEAEANAKQAAGRAAFINEEGNLPKPIRLHEERVAAKWDAYRAQYAAANPPKEKAGAKGAAVKTEEKQE